MRVRSRKRSAREPEETKSEAGERAFTLDDDTIELLLAYIAWVTERAKQLGLAALPEGAYLFWPAKMGPMIPYSPESIRKMFRDLKAGGNLRPHMLRKYNASVLFASGIPTVEILFRLGWTSETSAKPYKLWMKLRDQESAKAIGEALKILGRSNVVPIARRAAR